jgi:hypothetical protein
MSFSKTQALLDRSWGLEADRAGKLRSAISLTPQPKAIWGWLGDFVIPDS